MKKEEKEEELKAQFVDSAVTGFVFQSAIKSIVGYIAVWCFKPIWEKITKKISTKD